MNFGSIFRVVILEVETIVCIIDISRVAFKFKHDDSARLFFFLTNVELCEATDVYSKREFWKVFWSMKGTLVEVSRL